MEIALSKTRNFIKHLKKQGYNLSRNKGSHAVYVHQNGHHISFPTGRKHISAPMAKRLLKEIQQNIEKGQNND